MLASLFDPSLETSDPALSFWTPEPAPGPWALFAENLSARIGALRHAVRVLAHPRRAIATAWSIARALLRGTRRAAAPQSSINRPVAAGRRVRFARFELAAVKGAAHVSGGKVNDVVLDLAAGALRELLLGRGEPVDGVELVASIPVSLRSAEQASGLGNAVGVIVVQLPVGRMDAHRRLGAIVGSTTQAKREQHPAQVAAFVAWISGTPLAQRFTSRQRLINVEVTNVAGPPAPVFVLGARVLDVVPITPAVGNVTISLCAFSYTGCLYLVATADAHACPDIDRLIVGAQKEWDELNAGQRRKGCRRERVA
jgi:WS/DGAT/MGAT family acyltransferase